MIWKVQLAGFLVIVASGLSACAATQNPAGEPRGSVIAPDSSAAKQLPGEEVYSEERADPLEPFNQAMLTFNHKADDWVLHLSPPNGPTLCRSRLAPASVAFSRMSV